MSRLIPLGVLAVLALAVVMVIAAPPKKAPAGTAVTVAVAGLHCAASEQTLATAVGKLPGVSQVAITRNPDRLTAVVDETKTPVSTVLATIAKQPRMAEPKHTLGAELLVFFKSAKCEKEDAKTCQATCEAEVPKALKTVKGVSTVTVEKTGMVAKVTFAKDAAVTTAALTKALAASPLQFTASYATAAKAEGEGGGGCGMGDSCGMSKGGHH